MEEKKNNIKQKNTKKVEIKINLQNIFKWFMIGILLVFLVQMFLGTAPKEEIPISEVLNEIKNNRVKEILVEGEKIEVSYKDSDQIDFTRKEPYETFAQILDGAGMNTEGFSLRVKDNSAIELWGGILEILLPIALTAVIFLFIFRQMKGAQNSVFDFGKNRAKLFIKGKQNIRFADVGGVDEVKQELEEIVDFLKHPKKYQDLGAKTPKGVLLIGPAGTGKTLLAKAVAGEAGVTFLSMAGSEFMEMLVGVGASRVRDLFDTAKKAAPSIIFIDEIDAIGKQRGLSMSGGHDEREQTLNQILVEMDGFNNRDNVIVLAATNRADLLDPALLRPGRFDRRVTLDLPDIKGRKHILNIHAKGKPFVKDINWERVAGRTVGFSGADLENMLNEAAIAAARNGKKEVSYQDIEEAATKVKLGPQRKIMQSDEEKKLTAYHEAGHAVCTYYMKHTDPVHRISIVSRSMSLGQTEVPPERDKYQETKTELLDRLVMFLGGRAAEQVVFKEMTGGAASDIAQATKIARRMVIDYGMSELGPVNLSIQYDTDNYARSYYEKSEPSNETQTKVDLEIRKFIDVAYKKAIKTLKDNRGKLDLVASELVKKETLEREDFEKLMKA